MIVAFIRYKWGSIYDFGVSCHPTKIGEIGGKIEKFGNREKLMVQKCQEQQMIGEMVI